MPKIGAQLIKMVPPQSGTYLADQGLAYKATGGQSVAVRPQDVDALASQGWQSEAILQAQEQTRRANQAQAQRYGEAPGRPLIVGEPLDRVLPPSGGPHRILTTLGQRTYDGRSGQPQDVPKSDARMICANGWLWLGTIGTAEDRPKRALQGDRRFEGEPGCSFAARREVIFDGLAWRDVFTGEVNPPNL